MLFKNANIFVGGKFRHGSFRAENGRFTEILTTVPAEGGIDLNDQYVIPGLVDVLLFQYIVSIQIIVRHRS